MKEVVIGFVVAVALLAVILTGTIWRSDASCEAQWKDSGMNSDYTLLGGCRVQRTDGTWVPASAIRDLGQ